MAPPTLKGHIMAHYTRVETPFGNFAVRAVNVTSEGTDIRELQLTPIVELAEVPLTDKGYLDTDAIYRENERLRPEYDGYYVRSYPPYVINKKTYTGEFKVVLSTYPRHYDEKYAGRDWVRVDASYREEFTDAARKKIAAWMLEHFAEIVTEEFTLRTRVSYFEGEEVWRMRKVEEANAKLIEAKDEYHAHATAMQNAKRALNAFESSNKEN